MTRRLTTAACLACLFCAVACFAQEYGEHKVRRPAIPEKAPSFEDDAAPARTHSAAPVVRGQIPLIQTAVEEELKIPPDPPRGLVEPTSIAPQLTKPLDFPDTYDPIAAVNPSFDGGRRIPGEPDKTGENDKANKRDKNGTAARGGDDERRSNVTDGAYMALMLWAFVSTCLFAFSIFLFYDYRQRWIAALTTQNSRLVQSFDALTDGLTADGYASDSPFRFDEDIEPSAYGGVRFGELPELTFR